MKLRSLVAVMTLLSASAVQAQNSGFLSDYSKLQPLDPWAENRIACMEHRMDQNRAHRVCLKLVGVPKPVGLGVIHQKRGDFTICPNERCRGRDPVTEIQPALY